MSQSSKPIMKPNSVSSIESFTDEEKMPWQAVLLFRISPLIVAQISFVAHLGIMPISYTIAVQATVAVGALSMMIETIRNREMREFPSDPVQSWIGFMILCAMGGAMIGGLLSFAI